jgi:hypothetical protein
MAMIIKYLTYEHLVDLTIFLCRDVMVTTSILSSSREGREHRDVMICVVTSLSIWMMFPHLSGDTDGWEAHLPPPLFHTTPKMSMIGLGG